MAGNVNKFKAYLLHLYAHYSKLRNGALKPRVGFFKTVNFLNSLKSTLNINYNNTTEIIKCGDFKINCLLETNNKRTPKFFTSLL
jgi:hypothetical protein